MESISILDCTLRDGGYVNKWRFGYNEKEKIIHGLIDAGIDIIECGFITDNIEKKNELTKYRTIEAVNQTLPEYKTKTIFAVMINYGEYSITKLPEYNGKGVSGIRLAFHKSCLVDAIIDSYKVKEKGYKLFIQAMVSLNYSDKEFIELITEVNKLEPYAFYIVDSFGMMQRKDVMRLFYLIDNNLKDGIKVGFHSHNNLQMAFLNAQSLIDVQSTKELIVDSSIHGMGRGAGNLNTELLTHFLNVNYDKKYNIKPLLYVIDSVIARIYAENYWGYTISNYLSAVHCCHPSYASYLDNKQTLTVDDMDSIFSKIDESKQREYDENYIEQLYLDFMSKGIDKTLSNEELINRLMGKEVIIIAPGKNSFLEQSKIARVIEDKSMLSISVNFDFKYVDVSYIFVGNRRRFSEIDKNLYNKIVLTSNIDTSVKCYRVNYNELINSNQVVKDNSGLMLLRLLIMAKVKKVYIAGMDGFSYDSDVNFAESRMKTYSKKEYIDLMNRGMKEVIDEYRKNIDIEFITKSIFM